ncbi:hypothetical protein GGX14DRAFT_408200 [Mycena pura]|uniref:Uncharacterized protein n=1 Tax=Mycena pura TaxID=153505 RepID=A0AAD6Y1I9_9AGAR|nr:hypothetical protein GGX14DRAFT_408200 [Mycena pura]
MCERGLALKTRLWLQNFEAQAQAIREGVAWLGFGVKPWSHKKKRNQGKPWPELGSLEKLGIQAVGLVSRSHSQRSRYNEAGRNWLALNTMDVHRTVYIYDRNDTLRLRYTGYIIYGAVVTTVKFKLVLVFTAVLESNGIDQDFFFCSQKGNSVPPFNFRRCGPSEHLQTILEVTDNASRRYIGRRAPRSDVLLFFLRPAILGAFKHPFLQATGRSSRDTYFCRMFSKRWVTYNREEPVKRPRPTRPKKVLTDTEKEEQKLKRAENKALKEKRTQWESTLVTDTF